MNSSKNKTNLNHSFNSVVAVVYIPMSLNAFIADLVLHRMSLYDTACSLYFHPHNHNEADQHNSIYFHSDFNSIQFSL